MKLLITGGAGLVGTECCRYFAELGHDVISVDNDMRGTFFGKEGSTKPNTQWLMANYPTITHYQYDIRDAEHMPKLLKGVDAIIHAAAQPSHPHSIKIPLEDFSINAQGTVQLLEWTRQQAPNAVFILCSTNKVYGDWPNTLPYVEKKYRYDFKELDGINEQAPLDQSTHTPLGASKVAADIYTQEYGRLYGLNTGVFRMGCITGATAKAVEQHNWEPYFVKVALSGKTLKVFGHKGKQVRDVIHARDLARLFERFIEQPRPGEVYNIGGGRKNSISLLESFDLIQSITGKQMNYELHPEREGDHRVYISDLTKAKQHFPGWDLTMDLHDIFEEIHQGVRVAPELATAVQAA